MSQQRAALAWFRLADRAAVVSSRAGGSMLSTAAVSSSVSFFATNAAMQQQIDRAKVQAAEAGRGALASEIRYGGLFAGVVVVSMVPRHPVGGARVVRA